MPEVIAATDEDRQSPYYALWDYRVIPGRKVVNHDSDMWGGGRRVPVVHNDTCSTIRVTVDGLPHLSEAESERLFADEIERRRRGEAQWDWCLLCARQPLSVEAIRQRVEAERQAEVRVRMAAEPEEVRAARQARVEARMRARSAERGEPEPNPDKFRWELGDVTFVRRAGQPVPESSDEGEEGSLSESDHWGVDPDSGIEP